MALTEGWIMHVNESSTHSIHKEQPHSFGFPYNHTLKIQLLLFAHILDLSPFLQGCEGKQPDLCFVECSIDIEAVANCFI